MSNDTTFSIKQLEHIYVTDKAYVHALKNLNLQAKAGEFVSVVGPSGCGKSTLVRILSGLLEPTLGQVVLNGRAVVGPQPGVGIVFQVAALMAWRTVIDNVLLPVDVLKLNREEHKEKALKLLQMVGLQDFALAYPDQLSGGMQQRAAICRALVHEPQVLLMDEPFGALDALTREQMNLELARIWQDSKKTVLFITHSISEAVFLSDRIAVMSPRPGRIVDILDVPAPRPRTLDVMLNPDMANLVTRIRSIMGAQVLE